MRATIFSALTCLVFFSMNALAQAPASTFVPQNLGSGINTAYDEVSAVISADQTTLYFSRRNHPQNSFGGKNNADIWVSQRNADGSWGEAQRSRELNIGQHNYVLSFSNDGNSLLLHTDEGLSLATRQGTTWSAPQKLPIKATAEATLSADGQILLFAKGGKLHHSTRQADGSWSKPEAVKMPVKVAHPFLLANNKTLYFTSAVKGKQQDLFRLERLGDDWTTWSQPVALNDTINTAASETQLRTNGNGAWGYFTSNRGADTKGDIYRVKLYEDRPYVLVTGKIVNAKTRRPLTGKDISLAVNGQTPEGAVVNRDSATYQLRLPFGRLHDVSAELYQYGARHYTVDASRDREFRKVVIDLEEEPVAFALLKGKLMIKNTDRTIPAAAQPKIMVDGVETDSAQVDAQKGTYSLKLHHGTVYYVQVSAKRFESLPDLVDLKAVDGYEEINLDLQADAEKMAIVRGRIIHDKTGQPLAVGLPATVFVEGVSSVTAVVDSLSREYELRFPLKEKYVLGAVVPGYYPVYETIDVTKETSEVNIARDLRVALVERGSAVRLKHVFFEPKKAVLTPASFAELDRLITYLNEHPKIRIEIGAHTDPATKVSTLNQAKAVVAYLTSKGLSSHRVSARGYGATKPVASNKTPEGKAANRRVEFTVLEK